MPLAAQYSATPLQAVVTAGADLDLDGGDLRELPGFLDLAKVDVAQADASDPAVALEGGEGAYAGGERCPRVGRVELVEVDPFDPESAPAGLARRGEVPGAPVAGPSAFWARHSSLGGDLDPRALARPAFEGAADQPLVVTDLAVVPAIGVRSVQEAHTGVERRVEDGDGGLVAVGGGGQPHAAHAESTLAGACRHAGSLSVRHVPRRCWPSSRCGRSTACGCRVPSHPRKRSSGARR